MAELITAFSAQQTGALTGLSQRQLSYWNKEGFFVPELYAESGRPFGRIYSFRDVVGLRTIAKLRKVVSLQYLREVGQWFGEHRRDRDDHWSALRFFVVGTEVIFREPDSGTWTSTRPLGQTLLDTIVVARIAEEVRSDVEKLRQRQVSDVGRIKRNRTVLRNKPILAGTRITTAAIMAFHEDGYTTEQILKEYPDLTQIDVEKAITFERGERRRRRSG